MLPKTAAVLALLTVLSAASAEAQTTFQLPSFRYFRSTGGLMVPDQGLGWSAGSSRAARFQAQGGVPLLPTRLSRTGQSFGVGGQGGTWVSAAVYSLREMEPALPPEFATTGTSLPAGKSLKSGSGTSVVSGGPADQASREFSRIQSAKRDQTTETAKQDVRWARKFEAEGQRLLADFYYERAIKYLPSDLARLAQQEYDSVQLKRRRP
jgi:hypothetical protein